MNAPAAVVPFFFQSHEVRVTLIDNDPWFVAKDVCEVLDLVWKGSETVAFLDEDELMVRNFRTIKGDKDIIIISESGLYTLIFRSNKPQAREVRRWVTGEVLPSIRKTGSYSLSGRPTWQDNGNALDMAKTREGELMARELTLGVKVARAMGVGGRRQILEKAAQLAVSRTGVDVLDYFGVSLPEVYTPSQVQGETVRRFLDEQCRITSNDFAQRLPLRHIYDRFASWYGNMVDGRLRGIPSVKFFGGEIRRRGGRVEKIGGRALALGVSLVRNGEVSR